LAPLEMKAGETATLTLRSRTSLAAGTHLAWTATRRDAKGRERARQALNLDKGFLP
jgi:protein arginine N-methyltransferase 1